MRVPRAPVIVALIALAVVLQTTLLGQIRPFGPDVVLLMVILFALTRTRVELILLIAFAAGLTIDLVGASLVGLRAVAYTTVAYTAIRTAERAEIGRLAMSLWSAVLTFMGMALVVIVGTLFGQANLVGPDIGTRMILIPLINAGLAALVAPLFVRMIDRDAGMFRFT